MRERLQAILDALEDNDNSVAYLIAKHALAAEEKHTRQSRALENLLARIHRDGGHYLAKFGLEKTIADAESKVVQWITSEEKRDQHPVIKPHHFGALERAASDYEVSAKKLMKQKKNYSAEIAEGDAEAIREIIEFLRTTCEPDTQPADGAARCPRCGSLHKTIFHSFSGCGCFYESHHIWHDSKPMTSKEQGVMRDALRRSVSTPANGTAKPVVDDAAGGGDTPVTDAMFTCSCSWDEAAIRHWSKPAAHFIDLSRMLERQRDAYLREINELRGKISELENGK